MKNYKFYVYANNKTIKHLSLSQAVKHYENIKTSGFKALGLSKQDCYKDIDVLNNLGGNGSPKIIYEFKNIDEFKNDKCISLNIINYLKKEFEI